MVVCERSFTDRCLADDDKITHSSNRLGQFFIFLSQFPKRLREFSFQSIIDVREFYFSEISEGNPDGSFTFGIRIRNDTVFTDENRLILIISEVFAKALGNSSHSERFFTGYLGIPDSHFGDRGFEDCLRSVPMSRYVPKKYGSYGFGCYIY